MSLAERLRELRTERKISLQVVADAVGISKPHMWELEKGKTKNPSLELLMNLATFYGVSLDYLAGMNTTNSNELRYSALFRNLNPENMSESDWKMIEQAIDFAVKLVTENKSNDK